MRTFEWVFFLSFLPAVLLPFSPRARRHRRLLAAVGALPPIAALPHLGLEGWRTQLLPLYALAILIGAIRLLALRRPGTARGRGRAVAGVLLALAVIGAGVLPGWLLPVATLPAPTGPYRVGIIDREVVDGARGRRLMVSIWYPAARGGPRAKLTAHPDAIASGIAAAFGLPLAAPALQHLRYFTVAASEGVPVAEDGAPFPILVFSHGMVGARLQGSPTMQELASWGYVVVAIDHTDTAAVTIFPDGEVRPYDLGRFGITPADVDGSAAVLRPVWVADQRLVYDRLADWARDDPALAGKLDLGRIGSFGHSFGGATSLEVCRVDERCRAAVDLDGGVDAAAAAGPRPLLLLTATTSNDNPVAIANWSRLLATATAPASWLELPASNHLSFTILPLLTPLLVPPGADARAHLRTVERYLRAFFDLHLRGIATTLLESGSGDPEIIWHSR